MGRFRRFSSAVLSRVDCMVSRVENHEAQVGSALQHVQAAAARAKVQLARVKSDGAKLRERLDAARAADALWEERARSGAADDETAALECLRRRRRARREAEEIGRRLLEHQRVERQLAGDVASVEAKLGELREQRNVLRTRQSTAEALSSVQSERAPLVAELDDLFDRWEMRISEAELTAGALAEQGDAFEQEFLTREEEQELRVELAQLTRS